MIVGPNGTGKSTIASALCLGLGWKPHILGRANDVASYVKQGAENGSTEVELKNVDGPNFVIGRSITRASSTSLWSLNGRASSARAISELVEKLGIDMGNLCCFLPQDRVADFARMSPPELLRETQKAAGSPAMLAWHDQLIDLGRQAASASKAIATEREECVNLENRNEQMRGMYACGAASRAEIQLKVLAIRIAIAEYTEAQVRYKKYKDLRNKHKDTFNN
ncbi:hypothetical protein L7F22_055958 [Adiantum nelumboides]|nr:hypothetical protein [Adiantum nelumboides]